jgi:RimJ/RimL family protein N-acetyltransferase
MSDFILRKWQLSERVLQKAGFELEAVLKQAAMKNGKIIDEHYYGLLKSQWLANIEGRKFFVM